MKQRVRDLCQIGDAQHAKRQPLLAQWQDMALNFYPERADFMVQRTLGTEFAANLVTGEPALARREMANALSAMLRPRGQAWFHARTLDDKVNKDPTCKAWLDWASEIQRKFMYERTSRFIRSTKEADNDFVTFGQCVIQIRENKARNGLLYLNHHLRDVIWLENSELAIDHVQRNWKATARILLDLFPKTIHQKVADAAEKTPAQEIKARHVVIPRDEYESPKSEGYTGQRLPFVSIYLDVDNETILEEVGQRKIDYVIPRWQTVSGSQYAHSPATVIAIADARMLQKISLTLLEAGQKAVDPPLVAKADVLIGGANTFSGGISWIDAEYDEKLGEALRTLPVDKSGLSWGTELQQRISMLIKEAFYLNQLQMPEISGQMTAYETQKRFEEYMRRALPLFEPMETEYNGALCDDTFDLLLFNRAFGDMRDMPKPLRDHEIRFSFESPIQQAQERQNVQAFMQTAEILKIAAELDPSVRHVIKPVEATRDALAGANVPQTWIATDEEIEKGRQADQEMMAAEREAQQAAQGIDLVDKAGQAGQSVRGAMAPEPGAEGAPAAGGMGNIEDQIKQLLAGNHKFERDGSGQISGLKIGA